MPNQKQQECLYNPNLIQNPLMQKKQTHIAEQSLLCPICLSKFDYKSKLPLLFKSGTSYCKECVHNKLHLEQETGQDRSWKMKQQIESYIGWKNLDILQFIEHDIAEYLGDNIKEEYQIMNEQKVELNSELEETKVIMMWEFIKTNDKVKKLKLDIKKEEKRRRLHAEAKEALKKEQKMRITMMIKEEKKKGQQIDEEIKKLEMEVTKIKKKQKMDLDQSKLSVLYKDIKKEGLKYNFDKIKQPIKFVNPEESETEEENVEDEPPRVTKFFV